MVADKRVVLEGKCNADCGESLEYYWELLTAIGQVMDAGRTFWKTHTTTGRESAFLVIKPGTFQTDDQINALRVTGG